MDGPQKDFLDLTFNMATIGNNSFCSVKY